MTDALEFFNCRAGSRSSSPSLDVHHIYFEGIELGDGVWAICWGS